jgi:glutaminyl-tRNA synthetase
VLDESKSRPRNFIQQIIDEDCRTRRWGTWPDGRPRVRTRFPPEPNGYLHIGHAKSINLNYGLAAEYGGRFNLRFDDTNPVKEEQEYVDSIIADVRWLGARWVGMAEEGARRDSRTGGRDSRTRGDAHPDHAEVLFASDYFQQMYEWAVELIKKGRAYVCDQTPEQMREYRGTLTKPGRNSPYRERSVAENLELFERMRRGEFPDGSRTLRGKIDMASPNLNLRDPVMYRILHASHHRAGDAWCIYPMYDWAHGLEDSIEGITHSICTLEFENHRPLYDWFIDAINEGRTDDGSGPWGRKIDHPQQIEFARLNLNYTVMSKRKLLHLVKGGYVRGWDDPRMPTVSAMRRRGYTPEAIREFCNRVGVAKFDGVSEVQLLEHCVRDHLNRIAPRAMAVLHPLKLVIENWPDEGSGFRVQGSATAAHAGAISPNPETRNSNPEPRTLNPEPFVDWLDAVNNPEDPAAGTRRVPFSKVLYIERDDFMETPPPKYWRLYPGNEVRLRYAYFVRCTGCVKDPQTGDVIEVHCTYDPATRGGDAPDHRKVKSTIHWVSAAHAIPAEVRLYDHLFNKPNPEDIHEAGKEEEAQTVAADAPVGRPTELSAAAATAAPTSARGGPPPAEPWLANLNPGSLEVIQALVEPSLIDARPGLRYQFERHGYFCVDPDSKPSTLVFNRTVPLKDSWAKLAK